MNKQQIKDRIEELQYQLKEIELKEKAEKNKIDFVVIGDWAYETKEHDLNKKLSDIFIPKGKELWTAEDCIKLHNSHKQELNLDNCWFYIKQPFEINKNYVAWFVANSDWAYLDCDRLPSVSNSSLGVRFKWKVKV